MAAALIPRFDVDCEIRKALIPSCRLKPGEVWEDPLSGHRVGVIDATDGDGIQKLFGELKAALIINDPPYNISVGAGPTKALFSDDIDAYIDFCKRWLRAAVSVMRSDSFLYIWIGADQTKGFQPLPDLMIMIRDFDELEPRSFITMRNQRGYGTQKNWMFVRQELLCYSFGSPAFTVAYTEIPKILKGYYKTVAGKRTENLERSKSDTIRPGNVWVDIQQVFYRMEENVPGAYAQKPLKAIERIIRSSSSTGQCVADMFSHSGTTLLSAEMTKRRCVTCDIDPIFAELTIRRLEHFRKTGQTGWQQKNPFPEIDMKLADDVDTAHLAESPSKTGMQLELPLD